MDNANGIGCGYVDSEGWTLYVFNLECPLHGGDKAEEMDPETLCFEAKEYAEITGANALAQADAACGVSPGSTVWPSTAKLIPPC